VIDVEAHKRIWGQFPAPRKYPYFWPFHNVIISTAFSLVDLGFNEPFEAVFDEHRIMGQKAKLWYPVTRELVRLYAPHAYCVMPPDVHVSFSTDIRSLQLQAIEMFVWCRRNATDMPEDDRFDWLLSELTNVADSPYSQYYDRERMSASFGKTMTAIKEGIISAEADRIFKQIYEDDED
jgi:hypothetical protein